MNSNGWGKVLIPAMVGLMGVLIGYAIAPTSAKIEDNRLRTEMNLQRILTAQTETATLQTDINYIKESLLRIEGDIKEIKGK
uniref:Uncharacterized protein n=1 Tax=viral metagenome TaxID=1070528 RepID=A0A6M3IE88_9ZZZZ